MALRPGAASPCFVLCLFSFWSNFLICADAVVFAADWPAWLGNWSDRKLNCSLLSFLLHWFPHIFISVQLSPPQWSLGSVVSSRFWNGTWISFYGCVICTSWMKKKIQYLCFSLWHFAGRWTLEVCRFLVSTVCLEYNFVPLLLFQGNGCTLLKFCHYNNSSSLQDSAKVSSIC